MSLRAALYARYSSDNQKDTSIEDQMRKARERALREGWLIVAEHGDRSISGSVPVALRPGGKAMLADALAGRFEVLIVEGLDRLSREVGEAETITKRLEHKGIRIVGVADGYDSEAKGRKVMRIARGLINELYLDDLREKTHRGLAGQFERGFHVGGACYGYRSEPTPDGQGKRLVIEASQAETVRSIFEAFASGHSARYIAHRLNAAGIASPRGGTWAVSALVGDQKRGAGLLNNELYAGRVVWNRRQWLKDPETGKRRYVDRPREEWQTREVPELRIVPAELWEQVRSRARRGPKNGSRDGRGAAPRTLFSGVLRCVHCGGPMVAVDRYRYGCNINHDRGATVCPNPLRVRRADVERRLLAELRADLLSGETIAAMQEAVREVLSGIKADAQAAAGPLRARLAKLETGIANLVEAIADHGISAALSAKLSQAEAERNSIAEQVLQAEAQAERAAPLIDDALARYRKLVLDLRSALDDEEDRDRVRGMVAELIGPVVISADDAGEAWAEIEEPAGRLAIAVGGSMGLVARVGYESK